MTLHETIRLNILCQIKDTASRKRILQNLEIMKGCGDQMLLDTFPSELCWTPTSIIAARIQGKVTSEFAKMVLENLKSM